MLSLLTQLIDQLIRLVTFRNTQKREKFEHFIEPSYRKAQEVVTDLFAIYHEAMQLARRYSCDEFVAVIRTKREGLEQSRQRLLAVRLELMMTCETVGASPLFTSHAMNLAAQEMFSKILDLMRDPDDPNSSRPRNLVDALDYMISPLDETSSKYNAEHFLGSVIGGVHHRTRTSEQEWARISVLYSRLRLYAYK
jgi:hypothetical protein